VGYGIGFKAGSSYKGRIPSVSTQTASLRKEVYEGMESYLLARFVPLRTFAPLWRELPKYRIRGLPAIMFWRILGLFNDLAGFFLGSIPWLDNLEKLYCSSYSFPVLPIVVNTPEPKRVEPSDPAAGKGQGTGTAEGMIF
jgi:hypothetical protein